MQYFCNCFYVNKRLVLYYVRGVLEFEIPYTLFKNLHRIYCFCIVDTTTLK